MEDWIKDLKPGDEIAVFTNWGRRIEKVKSISSTFRVTLENGVVYNDNGYERGGSIYSRSFIGMLTDEIREDILRVTLIHRLKNTDFSCLDNEKLKAIIKILEVKKDESANI